MTFLFSLWIMAAVFVFAMVCYMMVHTLLFRLLTISKEVIDHYWARKKEIMLELTQPEEEMPRKQGFSGSN
jgi:hypothetical protein